MIGTNRARICACSTFAHSARLALPVSSLSCSGSAANDFTTRTPWMFSSTTVATSARRAWISHDTGNIRLRILSPAMKTNGIVESDERERHVDRHHQDEGEHDDAALHEDERRLRQVHLHGADVRVGARDELTRLHAVIERERHPREVLVDDVPEVVLDAVRSPQEQEAGGVVRREAQQREHNKDRDVLLQRFPAGLQGVDHARDHGGNEHLEDQADEGDRQGSDEDALVGEHDGQRALEPRLAAGRG